MLSNFVKEKKFSSANWKSTGFFWSVFLYRKYCTLILVSTEHLKVIFKMFLYVMDILKASYRRSVFSGLYIVHMTERLMGSSPFSVLFFSCLSTISSNQRPPIHVIQI